MLDNFFALNLAANKRIEEQNIDGKAYSKGVTYGDQLRSVKLGLHIFKCFSNYVEEMGPTLRKNLEERMLVGKYKEELKEKLENIGEDDKYQNDPFTKETFVAGSIAAEHRSICMTQSIIEDEDEDEGDEEEFFNTATWKPQKGIQPQEVQEGFRIVERDMENQGNGGKFQYQVVQG